MRRKKRKSIGITKAASIVEKVCYGIAIAGFVAYMILYLQFNLDINYIVYATGAFLLVAVILSSIRQTNLLFGKVSEWTGDFIFAAGIVLCIAAILLRVLCGKADVVFSLYTLTIASTSFLFLTRSLILAKVNNFYEDELSTMIVVYAIMSVICTVYTVLFLDTLLATLGCNERIINNVNALLAAALGGCLTLAGVAWTIKQGENARKEDLERVEQERKNDEKKKYKPLIFCGISQQRKKDQRCFINYEDVRVNNNLTVFDIAESDYSDGDYCIEEICIYNADFSFSLLKGICVNDNVICFEVAQLLKKEQSYEVRFSCGFNYKKEINEISLLLVDLLDNYYILRTNFNCSKTHIEIQSGIDLIPVKVDFENLKITKEVK